MNAKRSIHLIILTIFTFCLPGVVTAEPLLPGATILVDTYADEYDVVPNGHCSLREAIYSANNGTSLSDDCLDGTSGADTIILSSGFYYMSLVGSDDANQVGDFDIASEITIDGGGPAATFIEGRDASQKSINDRVFHVMGEHGSLTLSDLAVQYGNSPEHGGGILNEGMSVTLTNASLLHNNAAGNGGGYASFSWSSGAVAPRSPSVFAPALICSNCYIQENTAHINGGGIYLYNSMLSMDGAYFENNQAISATDGLGGAIYHYAGLPGTIDNAGFVSNQGGISAGAIYNGEYTNLTIRDSYFRENTAYHVGGALVNERYGTLGLDRVEITHNGVGESEDVHYGGGIGNYGTLTVQNTTLYDNRAKYFGGGLFNYTGLHGASLSFSTLVFNSDQGEGAGDGIYLLSGGSVDLKANIIAWNGDPSGDGNNCYGDFNSQGANLETGDTCHLGAAQDLPRTNPLLGSFGTNGSLNGTQTYSLKPGSPALDLFPTVVGCPSVDQRGLSRPVDGGTGSSLCDAGAYEARFLKGFLPMLVKP